MKKPFLSLLLLTLPLIGNSQILKNDNVDINKMIEETQISSNDTDMIDIAWWIPPEYWEVSFKDDITLSPEESKALMETLKDYNLLAYVKGRIGLFGGITYEKEDELFEKITFTDHYGDIHRPLKKEDISADMNSFLSLMKPILANMMGDLGENFIFFVFDAKNSSDKPIANPYQDQDFIVSIEDGKEYKFDLPLGSLLMPKICSYDNQEHNGKWNFCPYHGNKLENKTQD